MAPVLLNAMGFILGLAPLILTPLLLVRALFPSISAASTFAAAGAVSMGLNTAVPVALHATGLPISPPALSSAQAALLAATWLALRVRRVTLLPEGTASLKGPVLLWLAGMILIVPLTPLAGIDTYKWQDLATAVQVEGHIPWLIHPGGLFGFAPRGYPCAQPLALASAQSIGGLGVESGYYLVSCLSLGTAVFAAYRLGLSMSFGDRYSLWFAAMYAFAPVAIRYHHWATGRGFFLAVLPLFLLGLAGRTSRHAILALSAALLLLLSHKTAIVAVPLLAAGALLAPSLTRKWRIVLLAVSAAAALAVADGSLTPSFGGILTAFRLAVTRFGVLALLAAVAVLASDDAGADTPGPTLHRFPRRMLTLLLLFAPLSFTQDMYGALIVLPMAAIAATCGLRSLQSTTGERFRLVALAATALVAFGSLAIVANRDIGATPRRIRDAAVFLDNFDPQGPFRIIAPGGFQGRMQAYVRGCPRFTVSVSGTGRDKRPAMFTGSKSIRAMVKSVTDYLRNFLEPADMATDWYGHPVAVYHVIVDGKGEAPPGAARIYDRNGVAVFRQGTGRQYQQASP